MKKIREWFNELPEPFRTEALHTSTARRLEYARNYMTEAIDHGFIWANTPQGANYWSDLHRRYCAIESEQRRLKHESTPLV